MAEQQSDAKGCFKIVVIVFLVIIGIIIFTIVAVSSANGGKIAQATMSDIDGNWTQSLLSNTFTFIPSKNINGLVLQFDIYDGNRLVNTITKSIGNVKKGNQYTVTLTADEYWSGSRVKTSVKSGTISLF